MRDARTDEQKVKFFVLSAQLCADDYFDIHCLRGVPVEQARQFAAEHGVPFVVRQAPPGFQTDEYLPNAVCVSLNEDGTVFRAGLSGEA